VESKPLGMAHGMKWGVEHRFWWDRMLRAWGLNT